MNRGVRWLMMIVCCGGLGLNQAAARSVAANDFRNTSLDFETRTANLVEQMTLEEKISQIGNDAPAIERLGILQYEWWNECLHGVARSGYATVFPQAIGMAATFDPSLMYETACVISDEARAKHHQALREKNYRRYYGLTFWSPNINIFRDPRWGRGHETYGEDPYLTGQMGMPFVRGLQGDDPKYLKLVATAKHYAVHNGPEKERHHFNAIVDPRDLWETYLPAFHDLVVDAKAYSVMGAYNRVDGESASASWMLLADILRRQWKFDGYVVSDCGAIGDLFNSHGIVKERYQAAALGVRRGCDLNCGDIYQKNLMEAVEKGLVDEGEIDLVVYRLMLARMKLGMFDPPEMVPYAQIPFKVNDCEKHDEHALKVARESMTLLKNDGILPLDKTKIRTIAVVGPNANSQAALRGNYYGHPSHPVTVLGGLQNMLGSDVEILYSDGCPLVATCEDLIDSRYLSTTDAGGQTVPGLTGQYFRGTDLKGQPVLTRIDRQIKMDWGEGSPTATEVAQGILTSDQGLDADYFSVRWTGKLKAPVSGSYKIGLASDDGCRLFIDGRKIAEGWYEHGLTNFTGKIDLQEGQTYDIVVEYYEATQGAVVSLLWELPGAAQQNRDMTDYQVPQQTLDDVKKADVAIFVGGLDADWEGEEMGERLGVVGFDCGDRTRIELPKVQLDTIRAMQKTGTPVVFVLLAGSAIGFDGVDDMLGAVLMGWYPGQRGGDAVADVLFGTYNPAGRLPVTFYTSTDELGDFRDYNMTSGKGQTYRYYTGTARYPFGHGLSYTQFAYSDLKISRSKIDADDRFKVSVKVKNIGDCDGEEVVQLYVHDVESDQVMPVKQLRSFERIALKKGEQTKITFELNAAEDLRYYDVKSRQYAVQPGEFEIQVGASSSDIRLKKTLTVR